MDIDALFSSNDAKHITFMNIDLFVPCKSQCSQLIVSFITYVAVFTERPRNSILYSDTLSHIEI